MYKIHFIEEGYHLQKDARTKFEALLKINFLGIIFKNF